MNTEKVKLSQVKVNPSNPRTIQEQKLNLLVERLLVFPKMITIRPIVIDNRMIVLGGNMRVNALYQIAAMSLEQIRDIVNSTKKFQRMTQAEQEQLLVSWQHWLKKPVVDVVRASNLSEEEKKEFIIADNASFGDWDYDKLANEWNADDLTSWGLDIWQPEQSETQQSHIPQDKRTQDANSTNSADESDAEQSHITIVFPDYRSAEMAQLLGLSHIDKSVYSINELIPSI